MTLYLHASLALNWYLSSPPPVESSARLDAHTYNTPARTTVIATIRMVAITGLTASSFRFSLFIFLSSSPKRGIFPPQPPRYIISPPNKVQYYPKNRYTARHTVTDRVVKKLHPMSGTYDLYARKNQYFCKLLQIYPAFRLERIKVNRVRANGEGMGCTQRELQQPCSM